MVVDRQKGQNQIRVQEVQSGRQARGKAGRMVRQAGTESREQARVKTRWSRKRRIAKGVRNKHAG